MSQQNRKILSKTFGGFQKITFYDERLNVQLKSKSVMPNIPKNLEDHWKENMDRTHI